MSTSRSLAQWSARDSISSTTPSSGKTIKTSYSRISKITHSFDYHVLYNIELFINSFDVCCLYTVVRCLWIPSVAIQLLAIQVYVVCEYHLLLPSYSLYSCALFISVVCSFPGTRWCRMGRSYRWTRTPLWMNRGPGQDATLSPPSRQMIGSPKYRWTWSLPVRALFAYIKSAFTYTSSPHFSIAFSDHEFLSYPSNSFPRLTFNLALAPPPQPLPLIGTRLLGLNLAWLLFDGHIFYEWVGFACQVSMFGWICRTIYTFLRIKYWDCLLRNVLGYKYGIYIRVYILIFPCEGNVVSTLDIN